MTIYKLFQGFRDVEVWFLLRARSRRIHGVFLVPLLALSHPVDIDFVLNLERLYSLSISRSYVLLETNKAPYGALFNFVTCVSVAGN